MKGLDGLSVFGSIDQRVAPLIDPVKTHETELQSNESQAANTESNKD